MLKKGTPIFLWILVFYLAWTYTPAGEQMSQWLFDWQTDQQPIWTQNGIDSMLNDLPTLEYSQLDKKYRKYVESLDPRQPELLEGQRFYVVSGMEIFRYVAGDFRIRDFLPRDSYFYRSLRPFSINRDQYWLVDKQLLYKVLELKDILYRKGYNEKGFQIVSGFHLPQKGDEIDGANMNRHLLGQAVEIEIRDVNGDGYSNQADKTLLFQLLDQQIIGNMGGIGRNAGTMSLDFDVRGYRARWDQR
ncbi:MAG: hypothetical protein AAF990_02505 [Bacteroidota bacterium]